MNNIAEIIELIASGVDPTTGEVFDTEPLRGNPDIKKAIKKLVKVFLVKKSNSVYSRYEDQYPKHVIIMKEGFFYSAHNASAQVLNRELEYKLAEDMFDRLSTGGPDIDKITGILTAEDYSFIVVEAGEITQKYDGRYPFNGIDLRSAVAIDVNPPVIVDSKPVKKAYPENLLVALTQTSRSESDEIEKEFPDDIEARLDTALETYPERVKFIFDCRFKGNKTLQEIGEELELSRERIRQLIGKYLRRMRGKAMMPYLKGETESPNSKKRVDSISESIGVHRNRHREQLKLSSEQISNFKFSHDVSISISEIVRRITALKEGAQDGTLTYKDIAAWLVDEGYLEETTSGDDNLKRRPTQQGSRAGIELELRNGANGKYKVVVYNYEAQKFIVDHLQDLFDYLASEDALKGER
ncbi:MAG: hypothetical protein KBA08_09230 [Firmicutes bacterium]|nr:hypothetical protein [Bacillota bacterium]